jgi:sulfite exporter TauE/SafE
MILQSMVTGFLLGLSASPTCLGVCLPILLPHIGVVGGAHPLRAGFSTSLFFALGRLVLYLALGIALFALGASLQQAGLQQWVGNNSPWAGISRVLLALLIILYGVSVVFGWPRLNWCRTFFHGPRQRPLLSMLLGLLAGSIFCPALWLAFLYVGRLTWLPEAGLSILSFWLGSSILMIGLGVSAGLLLRFWRQLSQVQSVAGITLILVGTLYLIGG